jgi:hypothetical protein
LHGVSSSPDHIVFTADDYTSFYTKNNENSDFVSRLWKLNRLLVIGFGFRDPFLMRVAEDVLRELPSDDRHFAFIGYNTTQKLSVIERKTFSKKFRLKPIFYQVRTGEDGATEDHSDLTAFLRQLAACAQISNVPPSDGQKVPPKEVVSFPLIESASSLSKREFEKNLFVSWTKRQLFVQPRLFTPIPSQEVDVEYEGKQIAVSDLISDKKSYVINAPHEYGATTLCRYMVYEFHLAGIDAHYRDATVLPNYRKKLEQDSIFGTLSSKAERVLVLDNVNPHLHERLLKEIVGIGSFSRIIVVIKTSDTHLPSLDGFEFADQFTPLRLGYLTRPDVRTLATQLYDTSDTDLISAAVEKVYGDLIDLCIPLTPSNIIMYMSIVHREGDFIALNRLQIIDRYIREVLRRPSDVYNESFNADNKIDIVSLFLFDLYKNRAVQFTERDWNEFCKRYMERALISFDAKKLLDDLLGSRILIRVNEAIVFKYRLFYSYFLGRHVANRPVELQEFLANNAHMRVDGLVEVISGFSADNTILVADLTAKLEAAIGKFYGQYKMNDLDPFLELEWAIKKEEEKKTWEAISEKLSTGPANVYEIDQLKKSIIAEKRTEDQAVIIQEFNDIENSVIYNTLALSAAVRNSGDIDGSLKIRAMRALYDACTIRMQVALVFSSIIAEQKYFMWNGMGYVNYITYTDEELKDRNRRIWKLVNAIPCSMAKGLAEQIGTKKLGELYKYLAKNENLRGFRALANFALLLRAKPKGWDKSAEDFIGTFGTTALYLKYMLDLTMNQFSNEVNTTSERNSLKRLVAIIRTKRELKLTTPTSRAISKTIGVLKQQNFFKEK